MATIEVTGVKILVSYGTDKVILYTNLPQGTWPFNEGGETLTLEVAKGKGREYCEKHFPDVGVEMIELLDESAVGNNQVMVTVKPV